MKKLLTLLLLLAMCITVMSSCAADDGSNDETTTPIDTEETVTETEPETTEETTTTVKETEPPKEYEYTTVLKVDFTTMEDGDAPFSPNNISDLRIEGGLLKATSTGGDPYIVYNETLALDASTIQEIHIKLKNYSTDSSFQFFFTTETINWSEDASIKDFLFYSALDGDENEWNEIVLLSDFSFEWNGTITGFRIDPFSAEGDFEIEYVEFVTVTEK